jgi:hydrogenase maturation protease
MAPSKRLVVALGNPLLGADGFGAAVVERLGRQPDLSEVADVLDAGTDLLGHIDMLARYDRVILVDVIVGAGIPGQVEVYDEERFARWSDTSPSSHQMSPLLAVRLFRQLYPDAAARITLVGLSVDSVSAAAALSEAAVAEGVKTLARLLGLEAQAGLPPDANTG